MFLIDSKVCKCGHAIKDRNVVKDKITEELIDYHRFDQDGNFLGCIEGCHCKGYEKMTWKDLRGEK